MPDENPAFYILLLNLDKQFQDIIDDSSHQR